MAHAKKSARERGEGFLDGQLLVAMPVMTDPRFARSVIYMCAHSRDGAMGLILNQRAPHVTFADLTRQLGVSAVRPDPAPFEGCPVHIGGPVESSRGFVLHTSDYATGESSLTIDDDISLTATIDILKAIVNGEGPRRSLLALGYAGWSAGQLESEIHANGWLHCPPDLDLVFDADLEGKYSRAMAKIGVDPTFLVSDAGHA